MRNVFFSRLSSVVKTLEPIFPAALSRLIIASRLWIFARQSFPVLFDLRAGSDAERLFFSTFVACQDVGANLPGGSKSPNHRVPIVDFRPPIFPRPLALARWQLVLTV